MKITWLAMTALLITAMVGELSPQTNGGVWSSLPSSCTVGTIGVLTTTGQLNICTATDTWTAVTSGSVPSGAIVFIDTGTCPSGYAEDTGISGKTIIATIAANGDVGTTGGSDTITPAGTNGTVSFTPSGTNNAPAFTGNAWSAPAIAWPVGVPTFSGSSGTVPAETFTGTPFSSVINHTHTVTVTWNVQGGTTAATTGTHVMTSTATGGSARAPTSGDVVSATTANPGGGVSSITPAGTNSTVSFTPSGTVAWPAGVPTIGAYTPTGSVAAPTFTGSSGTVPAEAFTGTQFDNRSAWVKLIPCKKS